MKDLICRCNHKFSKHVFDSSIIMCEECWNSPAVKAEFICEEFKLDNLKYLEQVYEQKVKSND